MFTLGQPGKPKSYSEHGTWEEAPPKEVGSELLRPSDLQYIPTNLGARNGQGCLYVRSTSLSQGTKHTELSSQFSVVLGMAITTYSCSFPYLQ